MGIRRTVGIIALGLIVALVFAACSDFGADDDARSDDLNIQPAPVGADADDGDGAATADGGETDDSSGNATSDEVVDVGVVLSLSGSNAVYGNSSLGGIELALADYSNEGVGYSAIVLDDEADAETGAERFRQLVEHDVMAIFGPTLSNTAFEAHPVAQKNGVPVMAISNTAAGITDTGEFIFRVSLAEDAVVPQTIELIASAWRPESAALVYSEDDAWSRSSADAFRAAAAEHNIEIISEQDVESEGADYSEQVRAIEDANPDVILISALGGASIRFVTQARDHGLEQRIACGNGCNTGTFISGTGEAAEGVVVGSAWHIDQDSPESRAFVDRYREMHGVDPDQFAAQAYAGVQILAEALSRTVAPDQQSLRDSLANLGSVQTVLGPFDFDENRNGGHPAVITLVQSGEFVIFSK